MELKDGLNEPATETAGDVSAKEKSAGAYCSSNACMFSNYYTLAFLVPFLFVTAYSLYQGASCAASGEHACALSAVAVGGLAGLTSVGLVAGIKKFRKSTLKQA
jgi:hypothetical protein